MLNFKTSIMINIRFILFFIAIFASWCWSCQNFLEVKPDRATNVPHRLEDFQALLDNNAIMNSGTGHQLGEISSDNYFVSKAVWDNLPVKYERNTYIWERDIFEGALSPDWNNPSLVILYSNLALEGIEKIARNGVNHQEWSNIRGSALFFRAYAFYQMSQMFCGTYNPSTASKQLGVPLRMASDITLPTVRASLEQTYQQIIADLREASELLASVPAFKTRPSKPAAYALLSRVLLQMGDYDNALYYAGLTLDNFSVLMDYNTIDTTSIFPFAPYNDEVIFHSHMPSPTILSQNRLQVANELLDAYGEGDLRRTCFYRTVNNEVIYRGSYYGTFAFFTGLSTNEVYLIAAECAARLGNTLEALEYLNAVLKMRFKSNVFVNVTETNPQILLDIILVERRKELPFSGLRWSDLKRLNLEPRYAKKLERIWDGEIHVLEPNSPRYIFPIPDAVVEIAGIEQNVR